MGRREFIGLLSGEAVWPLVARAQQSSACWFLDRGGVHGQNQT
jgi:hypothetical protein